MAGSRIRQGLLTGMAAAMAALLIWGLGGWTAWEAKTWDWRAGLLARPGAATDDIRLILLDQNSLDWGQKEMGLTWPWPREMYGAVVDFCRRHGAKALAFDVLFTEPSIWGVSDDNAFASALDRFDQCAGVAFVGRSSGVLTQWPEEIPPPQFRIDRLQQWLSRAERGKEAFLRATLPIAELAEKTAVLCNIHMDPEPDGVYRRVKLFEIFDRKILPSLGIGAFLAAHKLEKAAIEPGRLTIAGKSVPIDVSGNAVLRFRGRSGTHKAYSAAAVIQSEIRIRNGEAPTLKDPAAFKDKYVLFGFTAPGLYDHRSAPVGGVYSGVEIHATVLDNFLSGDFIHESPIWLVTGLVLFLSLFSALMASHFSGLRETVVLLLVFTGIPVVVSLGAYVYGLKLPLIVQETAVLLSLLLALSANYATEGRQKRFIKNAFRQYLSPAVIEQLLQNPETLKLGGERKTLSIFFSDLQGFTSISEGLGPEELTQLLNDYLTEMTDIIQAEGGTVDKYEGDAIIAFWNAPLDVPDHAVRIVRAALACQAKLAASGPLFKKRIGKEMLMRIGINTGPAVVGNLGSHSRFDYTMLGDAVNLAARLEGANKQFGTYTMVSEYTRCLIEEHFFFRELARVAVVGRRQPVTVYEPMYADAYRFKKDVLEIFARGLDHFYGGRFERALALFARIEAQDPPATAYVKKCNALISAPPENWEGVWVMTSK